VGKNRYLPKHQRIGDVLADLLWTCGLHPGLLHSRWYALFAFLEGSHFLLIFLPAAEAYFASDIDAWLLLPESDSEQEVW
jgi:hypothetical protein